jgi:hypothetical protein
MSKYEVYISSDSCGGGDFYYGYEYVYSEGVFYGSNEVPEECLENQEIEWCFVVFRGGKPYKFIPKSEMGVTGWDVSEFFINGLLRYTYGCEKIRLCDNV